MVLLWTHQEEDIKETSERSSSQSTSFLCPSNGSPTSPGSIVGSTTHHPRVNGRPPKLPYTTNGKSNLSTSSYSSGGSSCERSEKLVVALTDVNTPKRINILRSQSTNFPKTSTPIRTNGKNIFKDSSSNSSCTSSNGSKRESYFSKNDFTSSLRHRPKHSSDEGFYDQNANSSSSAEITVTFSPVRGPSHACHLKSVCNEESSKDVTKSNNEEETERKESKKTNGKRDRKRFYSLPRNWRGKAQDFIWNKGKEICEYIL